MSAAQLSLPLAHGHDHYNTLHASPHGTVILWERANGNRWHKLAPGDAHIPALLAAQAGQPDRYITVNEFHGWRLVRLLKSLRANYVDIDGSEDLDLALETLREAQLPPPTAVVWSGRGLHLYWLHEPVPAQALPVWQRVQDALVAALSPMGADPAAKDCTRVLRLVGSVNAKNGAEVRGLVIDPTPYDFRHLTNEVLGYREPQPKAAVRDLSVARAERGLRIRTGSIYDRWHLVYQDLLRIAERHFLGGIPPGHRNDWLFLSAVSLSWFAQPDTLAYELERQSKAWTPDLSIAEVRSALKQPMERAAAAAKGIKYTHQGNEQDPRYKYSRARLLELMQPIIPDDLAPQLRAIVSDEVRKDHKRETDAAHQSKRYATHHADSAARLKPWEALGISRRTYYSRKAAGEL